MSVCSREGPAQSQVAHEPAMPTQRREQPLACRSFFCLLLRAEDPLRSEFCPDGVSTRQQRCAQPAQQTNWHCLAARVAGGSDGPAVLCPC